MEDIQELENKLESLKKANAQERALAEKPVQERSVGIRDIADAMKEKRTITLSGTGFTQTMRELVKHMVAKKDVLNYVRFFYGENANTVVPVWGTAADRPSPVSEGGDITASTNGALGATTLTPYAYATSFNISDATLKFSAVDMEAELYDILAERFADAIAYQIFNGDGTTAGQFTNALKGATAVASATASTLKLADLANLALTLKDKTDSGVIFMNPSIYNVFIGDTSDAQKIYREELIRNKMIEGVPVVLTSYAPSSTSDNALVAVAADWKNYAVAVGGELDITPKQTAGKLYTTYDAVMYIAGKPVLAGNFYALKVTATA